jgi:hypothetical protein
LRKECRLSRSLVSSSSQFALCTLVETYPLLILDFMASTNCSPFKFLTEPTCKWITHDVFLKGSWFRHQDSRWLEPVPFNILHTWWAAQIYTVFLFVHLDIFFKQTFPVRKFYSDDGEGDLNL